MCGYMSQAMRVIATPLEDTIGDTLSIGDIDFKVTSVAPAGLHMTAVSGKSSNQETVVAIAYEDETVAQEIRSSHAKMGPIATQVRASGRVGDHPADVIITDGLNSLAGALAHAVIERSQNDALELVKAWFIPLIRAIAKIESNGHFFGGLDPANIYFTAEQECLIRCETGLLACADGPQPAALRRICPGFAAPELYGRYGGRVGPQVDVYFLGAVLYALIARVAPIADCGKEAERYPAVRVFHQDVPHLLGAIARRAVSPLISRRYQTTSEMLSAVENALATDTLRSQAGASRVELKVGKEIHIGLLKGVYSPVNQDNMFVGYNMATGSGLFLVTDGVSISRYGTGDQASGCVRQAAASYWRSVQAPEMFLDDDPTLTISKSSLVSDSAVGNRRDYEQRCNQLDSILADANKKIGLLVESELPPPESDDYHTVEGIMAATTVAMTLEGNHAVFMFIGDSRIYLIRNGHIAQISIDHNLKTQLIRNGHSPLLAQTVNGANALVRCVGQFERGSDGILVSSPLEPEIAEMTLLPGDRLVLCSDGVTDYAGIDEEHAEELITSIVQDAPDPRWAAFDLMVAANQGGGGDNISCVVLEVLSPVGG